MGRLWLVPSMLIACSDPAAKPDAGVDAADPDATEAAVSITPTSFNFGELELGDPTKPPQSFAIQNITPAAVALTSIAIAGTHPQDFVLDASGCGGMLDAGATCSVSVAFDPTARDARNAQLEVTATTVVSAYLQGTATVDMLKVIIDPPSRDFGDVGVGETSAQITFQVINEAVASPLTPTVDPPGAFTIVSSDCATTTIPLHGTCTVVMQWSPTFSGHYAALLKLTAGSAGTWGAGLTGSSARPLAISPFSGQMGSLLVDQAGPTEQRTFTIRNTGTATTGTLAATFTGADAGAYIAADGCTTLAPDATCDVIVQLDKTAITTRGAKLAVLEVSDGTPTVVARASLAGSAYTVLINGDDTFPATTSGQQSAIQTFTVVNASDTDILGITTTLGSQFTIASDSCAGGIVAHSSCTVDVRFTPTSTGAKSADLVLTATGAGGTDTMTLTGTGQ